MKSCCDEYCSTHGCNQGRDCPVRVERIREAKRRLDADDSVWPSVITTGVYALIGLVICAVLLAAWSVK